MKTMDGRSRARPAPSREGGFTLVEIVVGIAILVVGLMGLAFAMVTSYRVDRVAAEKKTALTWATSQIERVRSLGYTELLEVPADGVGGFLVPTGDSINAAGFRFKEMTAGPMYFERWFHQVGTAAYAGALFTANLEDPLLAGLVPWEGMDEILTDPNQEEFPAAALTPQKYMRTVIGRVIFRAPDTGLNGVGEGTGYWVTARVQWKGASGPSELKLSTFVGK